MADRVVVVEVVGMSGANPYHPFKYPDCTIAVHDGTLQVMDADGPIAWFAHGIWKTAYYRDVGE